MNRFAWLLGGAALPFRRDGGEGRGEVAQHLVSHLNLQQLAPRFAEIERRCFRGHRMGAAGGKMAADFAAPRHVSRVAGSFL